MMITPADSPSSPSNYAAVPVQGTDIQAPQMDLSAAVAAAGRLTGAGVVYPVSQRQHDTESLIQSAPGYGDFDITAGWNGSGADTWPTDPTP
jgi:hypothetical protein